MQSYTFLLCLVELMTTCGASVSKKPHSRARASYEEMWHKDVIENQADPPNNVNPKSKRQTIPDKYIDSGAFHDSNYYGDRGDVFVAIKNWYPENYRNLDLRRTYGVQIQPRLVLTVCSAVSYSFHPDRRVTFDHHYRRAQPVSKVNPADVTIIILSSEKGDSIPIIDILLHPRCNNQYLFDLAIVVTDKPLPGKNVWIHSAENLLFRRNLDRVVAAHAVLGHCSVVVFKKIPRTEKVKIGFVSVKLQHWDGCRSSVCAYWSRKKNPSETADENRCSNAYNGTRMCLKWDVPQSLCALGMGTPIFCDVGNIHGLMGFIVTETYNCNSFDSQNAIMQGVNDGIDWIRKTLNSRIQGDYEDSIPPWMKNARGKASDGFISKIKPHLRPHNPDQPSIRYNNFVGNQLLSVVNVYFKQAFRCLGTLVSSNLVVVPCSCVTTFPSSPLDVNDRDFIEHQRAVDILQPITDFEVSLMVNGSQPSSVVITVVLHEQCNSHYLFDSGLAEIREVLPNYKLAWVMTAQAELYKTLLYLTSVADASMGNDCYWLKQEGTDIYVEGRNYFRKSKIRFLPWTQCTQDVCPSELWFNYQKGLWWQSKPEDSLVSNTHGGFLAERYEEMWKKDEEEREQLGTSLWTQSSRSKRQVLPTGDKKYEPAEWYGSRAKTIVKITNKGKYEGYDLSIRVGVRLQSRMVLTLCSAVTYVKNLAARVLYDRHNPLRVEVHKVLEKDLSVRVFSNTSVDPTQVEEVFIHPMCDNQYVMDYAILLLKTSLLDSKNIWIHTPENVLFRRNLDRVVAAQSVLGRCSIPSYVKHSPPSNQDSYEINFVRVQFQHWDACRPNVCSYWESEEFYHYQDEKRCDNLLNSTRFCIACQKLVSLCSIPAGTPIFCDVGNIHGLMGFLVKETYSCFGDKDENAVMLGIHDGIDWIHNLLGIRLASNFIREIPEWVQNLRVDYTHKHHKTPIPVEKTTTVGPEVHFINFHGDQVLSMISIWKDNRPQCLGTLVSPKIAIVPCTCIGRNPYNMSESKNIQIEQALKYYKNFSEVFSVSLMVNGSKPRYNLVKFLPSRKCTTVSTVDYASIELEKPIANHKLAWIMTSHIPLLKTLILITSIADASFAFDCYWMTKARYPTMDKQHVRAKIRFVHWTQCTPQVCPIEPWLMYRKDRCYGPVDPDQRSTVLCFMSMNPKFPACDIPHGTPIFCNNEAARGFIVAGEMTKIGQNWQSERYEKMWEKDYGRSQQSVGEESSPRPPTWRGKRQVIPPDEIPDPKQFIPADWFGSRKDTAARIIYKGTKSLTPDYTVGVRLQSRMILTLCSVVTFVKNPDDRVTPERHNPKRVNVEKVQKTDLTVQVYSNDTLPTSAVQDILIHPLCDNQYLMDFAVLILKTPLAGSKNIWIHTPENIFFRRNLDRVVAAQSVLGSCTIAVYSYVPGFKGFQYDVEFIPVNFQNWDACKPNVCPFWDASQAVRRFQDQRRCNNLLNGTRYCITWQKPITLCSRKAGSPIFCDVGNIHGLMGFLARETYTCNDRWNDPNGVMVAVQDALDWIYETMNIRLSANFQREIPEWVNNLRVNYSHGSFPPPIHVLHPTTLGPEVGFSNFGGNQVMSIVQVWRDNLPVCLGTLIAHRIVILPCTCITTNPYDMTDRENIVHEHDVQFVTDAQRRFRVNLMINGSTFPRRRLLTYLITSECNTHAMVDYGMIELNHPIQPHKIAWVMTAHRSLLEKMIKITSIADAAFAYDCYWLRKNPFPTPPYYNQHVRTKIRFVHWTQCTSQVCPNDIWLANQKGHINPPFYLRDVWWPATSGLAPEYVWMERHPTCFRHSRRSKMAQGHLPEAIRPPPHLGGHSRDSTLGKALTRFGYPLLGDLPPVSVLFKLGRRI
ncbi:hypothetical protein GE061_007803 [Apolygus lucorum]|uniref:Peptidase S1 domain-containing protein n=1 Tax=Apolygus lucorum TaxID=248454 RepID=A0A8S9WMV7_APOLU|nr:hypothetical protein GE061_007803 [Apolygus lucorum]